MIDERTSVTARTICEGRQLVTEMSKFTMSFSQCLEDLVTGRQTGKFILDHRCTIWNN